MIISVQYNRTDNGPEYAYPDIFSVCTALGISEEKVLVCCEGGFWVKAKDGGLYTFRRATSTRSARGVGGEENLK